VWSEIPAAADIVADQASYAIPVPAGGQAVKLLEVYVDGQKITPKTPDQLAEQYANWITKTGTAEHYTQLNPDNLLLVPIPDAGITGGLVVRGTFKPARTATELPDLLFNDYADDITNGAVAALCAWPQKPWTNPKLAAVRAGLFQAGIDKTKTRVAKSFARAPTRVRLRTF
jgi:hypothetical protein